MARDFPKDGSSYFQLGLSAVAGLITGAARVSVHLWAQTDTLDVGALDNRSLAIAAGEGFSGVVLCVDDSASTRLAKIFARSGTADAVAVATAGSIPTATDSWYSHGGMVDFTAKTMTAYMNGVAGTTVTGISFANNTFTPTGLTTAQDAVGGPINSGVGPPSTSQWDGRLAEIAVWKEDIGALGFGALARGESPLRVLPQQLVCYLPIGFESPREYLNNIAAASLVITGTINALRDLNPSLQPHGYQKWRDQGRRFLG